MVPNSPLRYDRASTGVGYAMFNEKDYRRQWRIKNRDRILEQRRALREQNREKLRAQANALYRADLEKSRATGRARHDRNKDVENARKRAWNKANTELVLAQRRRWLAKNPTYEAAWRAQQRRRHPEKHMIIRARQRARELGVPFDLRAEDIVVPDCCPALGIPLAINPGKPAYCSPTLDRLIPSLGYVRGNVVVISHRANTIKTDATLEELQLVAEYVRRMTEGKACP